MAIKLKDFLDNKTELLAGALIGLSAIFFVKWLVLATIPLCAVLYRLGGVTGGDHLWRKIGVPVAFSGAMFLATLDYWSLVPIASWWAILGLGSGIPEGDDKGSALGRFFLKLLSGDVKTANALVHLVIGALLVLTLLPLGFFYSFEYCMMALITILGLAWVYAN